VQFIHQIVPSLDEREVEAVSAYLRSGGWLTEFEKTIEFEDLIAKSVGACFASAVNNGTISLSLALLALGVGPGDEVLVPNLTMIASPNAAMFVGARPVLVDVSEKDLCMDLDQARAKTTAATKVVMYVNLNGRGKYLPQFESFCRERGLFLLEDAAQAMGSCTGQRFHGTFGHIGSYSFSPHKIITTGQGGALVTNDQNLYTRIEKLKDFGRLRGGSDIHDEFGINCKFTDVQAVIGIEQIKRLPCRIERKRQIYRAYRDQLNDVPGLLFVDTDLQEVTPWFVDIYVKDPEALQKFLKVKNIDTRRIYPPVHSQKLFQLAENFPVSEKYCAMGLWLPSSLDLTQEQIEYVCWHIRRFYS
jgi:perosamine synthetase